MKEINIAKTLVEKRKEKGITQDDLANFIGVTKASVSKWETGMCYPDITILPQLATYFNISIDELIQYTPQMTKEDIRNLYIRLTKEFSKHPFDQVIEECHQIIKKYYSCYPLLLQMTILFINHFMLSKDEKLKQQILDESIHLCIRIKLESDDIWLSRQANTLEATCQLIKQNPKEVLELLSKSIKPSIREETLLGNAYQSIGEIEKAKEVMQIGVYDNLLSLIGISTSLLVPYQNETNRFEEIVHRIMVVKDVFHLNELHPSSMLQFYLTAAQGYITQDKEEKALCMLKSYSEVCNKFFPSQLHGDDFFDLLENWFMEFDLGTSAPRDDKVIKESMLEAILANPLFEKLNNQPKFKSMIENMKAKLGLD